MNQPTPAELGFGVGNTSEEEVASVEALPKEVPSAPPGLAEEKLLYSLAERVANLEANMTILQEENAALNERLVLLEGGFSGNFSENISGENTSCIFYRTSRNPDEVLSICVEGCA